MLAKVEMAHHQKWLHYNTAMQGGVICVECVTEVESLLRITLEYKVNKMQSDASCPQYSGRADVYSSRHM